MHVRSALVLSALLAATALSGCGDDEEPATGGSTTPPTATSAATTSPADPGGTDDSSERAGPSAGSDSAGGRLTTPGTTLGLGEPAVVPFAAGDAAGVVRIVVREIAVGPRSDVADLDLPERARGWLPTYVRYTVTGRSDSGQLAGYSVDDSMDAVLGNGAPAQELHVIGDWAPCDKESVPRSFADGESFDSCVTFLSPRSRPVVAARYAPAEGDYNAFDGDPVVWRGRR